MSTPQQPQGDQNQPYIPQGYELAKKKKPFYQRLGCIIPLAIVLIIVVIIAVSSGGSDDSSGDSQGSDSADTAQGNGAEEGMEEQTNFQAGASYTTGDDLEITVTGFRTTSDAMGTQFTCGDVTYTNNGNEQASFQGYFDWKMQNPSGVITDPALTGENTLNSGELASGGTVSGSVCFDGAAPGEYRLIYEPTLSFNSDTATWVTTL